MLEYFPASFFHLNERSKTVSNTRCLCTEHSREKCPTFPLHSSWDPLTLNLRECFQKQFRFDVPVMCWPCCWTAARPLTLRKTCLHKELSWDGTFLPSRPWLALVITLGYYQHRLNFNRSTRCELFICGTCSSLAGGMLQMLLPDSYICRKQVQFPNCF